MPDALPRRTLEVQGTAASAIARNTMGQTPGGTLELFDATDGSRNHVDIPPEEDLSPFLNQVEAFADSLLSGTDFPFPPQRDLRTMRVLAEALEGMTANVAVAAPPAAGDA
jgi:predicted dehydrogenase